MDDNQQPGGQLPDDQQRQREKEDQELLDGAESGVYVPAEAGDRPVIDTQSGDSQPRGDSPQPGASQWPNDPEPTETTGQKVFAVVFLAVLLAVVCGVICVVGGQWAIATENEHYHHHVHVEGSVDEEGKIDWFVLFRLPFLRDWRVQFLIGAVFGAGSGVLFCYRFWSGRVEDFDPEKVNEPRL